jgi:spectinomycin phosphotransferase
MLEKPDLQDQLIISRLADGFGLQVSKLDFLPLGADVNTAVYQVIDSSHEKYFLKLSKSDFDKISVLLPRFLSDQGLSAIIAPLETTSRQFRASLGDYTLVLYPFIDGKNGYEVELSDRQWLDFGSALKSLHKLHVPSDLANCVPTETYSTHWYDRVKTYQAQAESRTFIDPTAARLAEFMRSRRNVINRMLERADLLGQVLQARSLDFVLCHSDVHAGNLLISADGSLFLVDWDNPIFAPRERDLALIGGCPTWNSARQVALFFQGYGTAEIDTIALAYFRYERTIQDVAAFCEQIFLTDGGGEDRERSYEFLTGLFLPGHEVDFAVNTDAFIKELHSDSSNSLQPI